MKSPIGLDQCLSFINCHLQPPRASAVAYRGGTHKRAITISRQAGAGGHAVAEELVKLLRAQNTEDAAAWTVFDRNLVDKVLEDHHLPGRLARFMPEDRISGISDTMDELFGLHPPSGTLVRQAAETMLRLVELGNVILIGRGATVITSRLDYVFHVRLVGSLERRVRHTQELSGSTLQAARQHVNQVDLGRKRYLEKYFHRDIDDPQLYHLVINTDLVPYAEAARMVATAVAPKAA